MIKKLYDIRYNGAVYRSIAYTIDEIISTGNLSLFSLEKKTAILELKAIQEFYEKNRIEVEQKWTLSNIEFENAVDLVSFVDRITSYNVCYTKLLRLNYGWLQTRSNNVFTT